METGYKVHGFTLLEKEFVEEIKTDSYAFIHDKTKAELRVLACDDDNKVFCISFRTPPSDHSGVPHILEHSVLNGSKKYPVKEP
ncbi:MAG: hypothetical protein HRT89_07380, partial [Lentisphaeria bacterium]|nr:hypothetical protein [Lentisphaeria bacterium]